MRIGTKTLLFGVHQLILHPLFVSMAWRKLYGKIGLKDLVAIFLHDLGYFGRKDLDGDDTKHGGVWHPSFGAKVADRLLGKKYGVGVLCHSRTMVRQMNENLFRHLPDGRRLRPSPLCWADKYSNVIIPKWLFLLLAKATGEYASYRDVEVHGDEAKGAHRDMTDAEWMEWMRDYIKAEVEKGLAKYAYTELWEDPLADGVQGGPEENMRETFADSTTELLDRLHKAPKLRLLDEDEDEDEDDKSTTIMEKLEDHSAYCKRKLEESKERVERAKKYLEGVQGVGTEHARCDPFDATLKEANKSLEYAQNRNEVLSLILNKYPELLSKLEDIPDRLIELEEQLRSQHAYYMYCSPDEFNHAVTGHAIDVLLDEVLFRVGTEQCARAEPDLTKQEWLDLVKGKLSCK